MGHGIIIVRMNLDGQRALGIDPFDHQRKDCEGRSKSADDSGIFGQVGQRNAAEWAAGHQTSPGRMYGKFPGFRNDISRIFLVKAFFQFGAAPDRVLTSGLEQKRFHAAFPHFVIDFYVYCSTKRYRSR